MIRALPPVPTRDDPTNFALKADAFLAALPGFADDANALEQSLQLVATTGTSVSTLTVGVGSKSLTTQPGKAWATGAWVYVFAAAAVSNYMVGRVTSYDVVTGALVVNVSAIDGSGSHSSWIIGLGTPVADGHLVARDGSRAMTSELILSGDAVNALGAVSLEQVQALIAAARTVPSGTVIAAMRATIPGGWLPLTGGTIGSAASGGTARANADAWPLFEEVWLASSNADLLIQTSAGAGTVRGASAAADFAANKRLPLPNVRDGDALLAAVVSGVCGLSIGEVISHNHTFLGTQVIGGSQAAGGNQSLPQNVTWSTANTGGSMNRAAGLFTKFLVAL